MLLPPTLTRPQSVRYQAASGIADNGRAWRQMAPRLPAWASATTGVRV